MGRRRILKSYDISQIDPTFSQAERIIDKLGGVDNVQMLLGHVGLTLVKSSIFRWMYPRDRGGSGGVIPHGALDYIFKAARLEGIILTAEDLDPRRLPKKITKNDVAGRTEVRKKLRKRLGKLINAAKRRAERG